MQKRPHVFPWLAAIVVSSVAVAQTEPGMPASSHQPAASAIDMAPVATHKAAAETATGDVAPPAPSSAAAKPTAVPSATTRPGHPTIAAPERAPKDDGPATLLPKKGLNVSGYGGVSVFASRTMGQNVAYVGGEAAVLLGHRLAIGIAGHGLASQVAGPDDFFGVPQQLSFGYGGFLLRYSFLSKWPCYFTIGTLVGAGGVAYTPEWTSDWSGRRHVEADPVFVFEPSIGGHLNLTRWMRVGAQVSYRLVTGMSESSSVARPRDSDLSGLAYGGHLQFGWL
jgi:hypothetical protein